jgi:hypothetical protein
MHFLTRAWHAGEMSDDRADELSEAYRAHQAAVLPQLPERFRAFTAAVSVHDARVRAIRLDRAAATLELELRAGDQQGGYFDLSIRYRGVHVDRLEASALAAIAQERESEALYVEADLIAPTEYEHRWLWWPYQDLDVRFSEFEYAITPRPNRTFTRDTEPYVEIPSPVG